MSARVERVVEKWGGREREVGGEGAERNVEHERGWERGGERVRGGKRER